MSESVTDQGTVEGTTTVEEAEAIAAQIFGTPEGRQDPYPLYHRLRELAPVLPSQSFGMTLLTRYDDCQAVLRDPRLVRGWSTRLDRLRPTWRERPSLHGADRWMIMLDGADHTRLRKLVTRAFTPRTVERLRPRIEAMVDSALDALAAAGGGDLMEGLAFPLPVRVIAELLGVPLADCDQFRPLMQNLAGMFEMDPGPGVLDAADRAWVDIEVYFAGLITEKRKDPDDALISRLLAVDDNGDRLSDDEIIGLSSLTFLAGFETTTSLIGNGMIGLLADPVQIDHLRADPSLFPRLPDELLRYEPTVQLLGRMTADEIEVDGHILPAGTSIMAIIGAANRDPARFPDPDRLDVTREDIRPLSFGGGVHYCLGAALARLETEIVFNRFIDRFGTIELAGEAPRRDTLSLRCPLRVPLALSTAPPTRPAIPSAATTTVSATTPADQPAGERGARRILPLRPAGQDLEWRNQYRRHVETAAVHESGVPAVVALLRRVDFFAGCSDDELTRIATTAYPLTFEAGSVVCAEGAESLECYVIAVGTVAVTVGGEAVATLGANDVVGERGPVVGAPRSATVTATSNLYTYAISRDRLLELLASPAARAGMEAAMEKRYGGDHPSSS
ncbi:MAG TPA: cytochrome P450 [Acidimicrobiia bacterium]|nr:cytochrome P450 [Acidimicrobiia bacterium]